jgi:hypothetical protein
MTLADVSAHRSARRELKGTVLALEHFSLFPFYLLVIFAKLNLLILSTPAAAAITYLIAT